MTSHGEAKQYPDNPSDPAGSITNDTLGPRVGLRFHEPGQGMTSHGGSITNDTLGS
jgi:hypothetical protein